MTPGSPPPVLGFLNFHLLFFPVPVIKSPACPFLKCPLKPLESLTVGTQESGSHHWEGGRFVCVCVSQTHHTPTLTGFVFPPFLLMVFLELLQAVYMYIHLLYNFSMLLDLILSGYNFIVAPICCLVLLV